MLDAAECPPTFGVSPDLVVGLIAGGPNAFLKAKFQGGRHALRVKMINDLEK